MVISGFKWDDDNVRHIDRHQFTPEEVEEVFAGDHKVRRARDRRYIALGETFDGRLAFVVFRRLAGGLIRVITAREMDDAERRLFRRKQVEGGVMKKKLSPVKAPLPKLPSDEEAAKYFESHSVADVWDQLPEDKPAKLSAPLRETIRARHTAAKSPVSLRLEPQQIAAAKKIAAAKSVGYQTQLRMWIADGIRREAKRA